MLHIVRGPDGSIDTISRLALPGSQPVDDNDPEAQGFLQRGPKGGFNQSDADFVRVLEDLIDTLISKNVIRHTDLPQAAQQKLIQRKGLRNRISGALDFLGDDERLL